MKLKILTVRWDDAAGGFDDAELQAFQADKEVIAVDQHFLVHEQRPAWVLLISYREATTAGQAERAEGRTGAPGGRRSSKDWRAELDPVAADRHDALRTWRRDRSAAAGRPPYVLLTNRQMAEVARRSPTTLTGLGFRPVNSRRIGPKGRAHGRSPRARVLTIAAAPARAAATAARRRGSAGWPVQ
jgi:hypothetical protein